MSTIPNFSQPIILSEVSTPLEPDSGFLKVYAKSGALCSVANGGSEQSYLTSSNAAGAYLPLTGGTLSGVVTSQPGSQYNGYAKINGAVNGYPNMLIGAYNLEAMWLLNAPSGGTVDFRCPSTMRILSQDGNAAQALTCGAITTSGNVVSTNTLGGGAYTTSINVNNPSLAAAPGIQAYFSGDERGRIRFGAGSGSDLLIQPGTSGAVKLVTIPGADAALTCGTITASGNISTTGTINGSAILCDGSTVFDTSGYRLDCGVSGGFNTLTVPVLLQFGGTTSSFPAIKRSSAAIVLRLADDSADAALTCAAITASGNITTSARIFSSFVHTNQIVNYADTRYIIEDAVTGVILCRGNATSLVQIGGTTSAYPAIKRSSAAIALRLADDSADAALTCGAITASGLVTAGVGVNIGTGYNLQIGPNVYVSRGSGSTLDLNADAGVRVRNYANSADAPISCGAITASGLVTVDSLCSSSLVHPSRYVYLNSSAMYPGSNNMGLGTSGNPWGASYFGAITASGAVTVTSGSVISNTGMFQALASGQNMFLLNSAGTSYGSIGNDAGDKWSLGYKASSSTALGTPVLTWTVAGFVGINKVSPTVALDVTGAITASGAVTAVANDFYVSDSGTYYFSNTSRNRGILISSGSGGRIGFKAGGTEWLQISDAGAITASGTATISIPTATTKGLILKTTDDSISQPVFEVQSSAGTTVHRIQGSTAYFANVNVASALTGTMCNVGNTGYYQWGNRSIVYAPAVGQFSFKNIAETAGATVDVTTDGTLTIKDRAGTAAGNLACGAITATPDSGYPLGQVQVVNPSINSSLFPGSTVGAALAFTYYGSGDRRGGIGVNNSGHFVVGSFANNVYNEIKFAGSATTYRTGTHVFRNAADSADGPITCGAITASDHISLPNTSAAYIKQASGEIIAGWDPAGFFFGGGLGVLNSTVWIGGSSGTTRVVNSGLIVGPSAGYASERLYVSGDAKVTGAITASGAIQETPTQSSLDPTTTDIPTGKRMGWYNSTSGEFRDWVNIGGTLLKSAAYT